MLSKTTLTLTAGSALLLTAAAFTPASANYAACTEQPSSAACRSYDVPTQRGLRTRTIAPQHAVYREHATKQPVAMHSSVNQASAKKPEPSARHARSHEAPKSEPKSSS